MIKCFSLYKSKNMIEIEVLIIDYRVGKMEQENKEIE